MKAKRRKSILVVNDDGIYGQGLQPLARALEPLGQVTVVVPEHERSAASQSITLHKPIRVRHLHDSTYIMNGTPADCVRFGVITILKERVDVVVSGVNRGANMGSDIFYSGTVGAAREGCMLGFSSVAVSLARVKKGHFDVAAQFTRRLVEGLLSKPLPQSVCLNVNVPDLPASRLRGVEATHLGKRIYGRVMTSRVDPRGETYHWLAGAVPRGLAVPGSDIAAVRHGKISVTPLRLDMTDKDALADWAHLAAWK